MRTTLTLDPDVARRLEHEMRRSHEGLKAVVNRALRAGLGMSGPRPEQRPFKVVARDLGVRAGIDLDRMNQLADEIEVEERARKLGS